MRYCSYEITPKRVHMKSDSNNYNIDDLNSEDSTDEDDRPRKPIPLWASGMFPFWYDSLPILDKKTRTDKTSFQ